MGLFLVWGIGLLMRCFINVKYILINPISQTSKPPIWLRNFIQYCQLPWIVSVEVFLIQTIGYLDFGGPKRKQGRILRVVVCLFWYPVDEPLPLLHPFKNYICMKLKRQ